MNVDIEAELQALRELSDDALWAIAKSRVSPIMTAQIQGLLDLENRSYDSQIKLDELLEPVDRLTLRKGEAMVLLKNRGYALTQDDLRE